MNYYSQLALEVLGISLITALIGSVISLALMFTDPNFKLSEYDFWPQVALSFALTGAIIHLLFEFTGGNKWYVCYGAITKKLH
jgi:hypothetical protein